MKLELQRTLKLEPTFRDGIDFSDVLGMQAIQEWDLVENFQGVLEYQTRYSKFQNMASTTLHFPDSLGGDTTKSTLYTCFKP
ncbi:PITH domain-containing protein 1 [Prunus yedoensis var. nudiflora]|uniref:PITH domain-containing protein 1 n=1 Tax=Prunus yedoensis var. nudiflora TaxID=2094558 RepID=A0A314ZTT3_PRUYE|nr:PITH domain-containing protein 1 [Prunus yedoensis var. nudiflora]